MFVFWKASTDSRQLCFHIPASGETSLQQSNHSCRCLPRDHAFLRLDLAASCQTCILRLSFGFCLLLIYPLKWPMQSLPWAVMVPCRLLRRFDIFSHLYCCIFWCWNCAFQTPLEPDCSAFPLLALVTYIRNFDVFTSIICWFCCRRFEEEVFKCNMNVSVCCFVCCGAQRKFKRTLLEIFKMASACARSCLRASPVLWRSEKMLLWAFWSIGAMGSILGHFVTVS